MSDLPPLADDKPTGRANWLARHELLVAFALGVAAMWYVQSGSYEPGGRDSFYHIKMAALMPEIGYPDQFHWLRHTIFNDKFVSHHTGFQMALVPFVYASKWTAALMPDSLLEWARTRGSWKPIHYLKVGLKGWLEQPYILGAKLANTLLFGLVATAVMMILRHLQVGFRWFWMCAFFALPWEFYLRLAYIRAPIASLLIMLLACYCCMNRRFIWLGILGLVYGHVYLGGLLFFPPVVGAFVVAGLITRQAPRPYILLAVVAIIGTSLALLTHPYFPDSVAFLKVQILKTGLQLEQVNRVGVGVEWKPYELQRFATISGFVLAILLASIVLRVTWSRLRQENVIAFLLLCVFFLVMCLKARRFIEYWPAFALISSAALWSNLEAEVKAFAQKYIKDSEINETIVSSMYGRIYITVCIVCVAFSGFALTQARKVSASRFDHSEIVQAMDYLEDNTPPGSLVFADDWDVFPMFFYYNHHNHYVCGLDPQFSNTKDPVMWERYCVITQGRSPKRSTIKTRRKDPASGQTIAGEESFHVKLGDIAEHFNADFVIVDDDHDKFYDKLSANPALFEFIYPLTKQGKKPSKQPDLAIFKVLKTSDVVPTSAPASPPSQVTDR